MLYYWLFQSQLTKLKAFSLLFLYLNKKAWKTSCIYICTCTHWKRVFLVLKELKIKLSFLPSSSLTTNDALQEIVPAIALSQQSLLAPRANHYYRIMVAWWDFHQPWDI